MLDYRTGTDAGMAADVHAIADDSAVAHVHAVADDRPFAHLRLTVDPTAATNPDPGSNLCTWFDVRHGTQAGRFGHNRTTAHKAPTVRMPTVVDYAAGVVLH